MTEREQYDGHDQPAGYEPAAAEKNILALLQMVKDFQDVFGNTAFKIALDTNAPARNLIVHASKGITHTVEMLQVAARAARLTPEEASRLLSSEDRVHKEIR